MEWVVPSSTVGRGSGVAVGDGVDVGTGVGVGVLGIGVAVDVGDGVGVSGTGAAVDVGDGVGVLGTGAAVAVGDGVGVSGRGVDVAVGARATAGTGVEVGGWLTVSEPPQATAKKSVAPISVRRMREESVTSSCPLPAWVVGYSPQVAGLPGVNRKGAQSATLARFTGNRASG